MSTTPSQQKLFDETDARFWAQTGYKPQTPLDPNNPLDKKMIPTWSAIYAKVLAEAKAGNLTSTHDHPIVQALLSDAKAATAVVGDALKEAAHAIAGGAAKDSPEVAAPLAAAHEHHAKAADATKAAAKYQPHSVPHHVVHRGSHDVIEFVMNDAGQGVPVIASADPIDAAGAMQAAAAPDKVAAAQATPDVHGKTVSPGESPHLHKFSPLKAAGIGAGIVGVLLLTAYGIEHRAAPRVQKFFSRRARRGGSSTRSLRSGRRAA